MALAFSATAVPFAIADCVADTAIELTFFDGASVVTFEDPSPQEASSANSTMTPPRTVMRDLMAFPLLRRRRHVGAAIRIQTGSLGTFNSGNCLGPFLSLTARHGHTWKDDRNARCEALHDACDAM